MTSYIFSWSLNSWRSTAHITKRRKMTSGAILLTFLMKRFYQRSPSSRKSDPYTKYWEVLELDENSDSEEVRQSYLRLSKRFHPDSNSNEASVHKFHEIDTAYKKLQVKFADERHNGDDKIEGEFGLYYEERKTNNDHGQFKNEEEKHTAPQHRQYLSFDGVGIGTLSQREKQYQKHRAAKAIDNVQQHRLQQVIQSEESNLQETSLVKDAREAKKIKTGLGIERLVEDMIQESMARGEFKNLKGHGKPLSHDTSYNPYIDFVTHKMNQVLIDNGFVPEWILLEKEIRQEIGDFRNELVTQRHNFELTLTTSDLTQWDTFLTSFKPKLKILNLKINKYNLVVPSIHKQIIGLELERESKRALQNYSEDLHQQNQIKSNTRHKNENSLSTPEPSGDRTNQSVIGLVMSIFKF